MIAEVIVDVSAYPIDRPFDYQVPVAYQQMMTTGIRVKVPFGRRKVLGYVVGLKEESALDLKKLKSIEQLVDLEPILSKEQLALSIWLANRTLAYRIDALQAMLPAAMRAKYDKFIIVHHPEKLIDEELKRLVNGRSRIPLEEVQEAALLRQLQQYREEEVVTIETTIEQQVKKKQVRMIQIADAETLQQVQETIAPNAARQIDMITWLVAHASEKVTAKAILDATGASSAVLKTMLDKGIGIESYEEVYREPLDPSLKDVPIPSRLTEEQEQALGPIERAIEENRNETFLLHGVTGSGKTEVYLRAIEKVLARGEEAIVLVPEISLTPQMTSRFKARFGHLVAVMHSALSQGEKYDEWRKIDRGEVKVVIGARSAIFAPFKNIGLIILDEEHESTYKQEESPRYHAREVAIERAKHFRCPVILGSATPSLESYARTTKNVYTLLTLTKRAKQISLPSVDVVDMREQLQLGNRSMFSIPLADAISERLEKKQQIVLFLNRRGFSSFVLCRDCGTTVECPNCDISLTYHRASELLKCHYCGHEEHVPTQCPQCESEHIRFFGTGTQRVEEEITKLFPEARVIRMDVDTTSRKGSHEKLLRQFSEGEADILLGTQMIAKGLDFPNITLVGVLAADTTLHLADFRAAEKTFQLMTQVSGRAGRHELPGEVFIQTYSPEHYAIELAKEQHYEPFYEREMKTRKQFGYPPFYYFTLVQFSHEDVLKVNEFAQKATGFLREQLSTTTMIIGPTASAISRMNNRYRYQCLIKYKQESKLIPTLQQLIKIYRSDWIKSGLTMTVDMDPMSIF